MRRFFIDPTLITGDNTTIIDQEARHISTVLRLKPGNVIELFDGTGLVYQVEISTVSKSSIKAKITKRSYHQLKAPFLTLAQSVIKGKKMDLIVQKATELGVSTFQPIISQHCDIKTVPNGQLDRWQRISLEACKQCNRPTPMICLPTISIDQLIFQANLSTTKFIFWENSSPAPLPQQLTPLDGHVLILIGPEGGFSKSEVQGATRQGFVPKTLGPLILRAETAAITAISIIQFLLGNLNQPECPIEFTDSTPPQTIS
ncbi:MAG: 16S rRNA (uracil(1498)-N(3))-methyltransferase [Desulfobulbaceae bacterium]|nr:16S rRNA (uracil(1498)-N(3))-methyltransferase [Desulfobulbaceae bacterium]